MKIKNGIVVFLISIIILVLISSRYWANGYNETYGSNRYVGKNIYIRDIRMHYEIYGKGEPLLMIHPNGGSIGSFNKQIKFFSRHYRVIVADSRSQGISFDSGDSLSYEMMADDYNALLDSLRIDSCYVLGWSDGGINGLLLAIRHPSKVKKLAITGANLWPDTTAIDSYIFNKTKHYYDSILHSSDKYNERKTKRLLISQPNIEINQLNRIQIPTLVIGGDHDVIIPSHTVLIAESIPNSNLWIVPNSGHAIPRAYSKSFNEVVYKFYKEPYKRIDRDDRFR